MLSRPDCHISGAIGCHKPDAGATQAALALRAVLAKDHRMHPRHFSLGARALTFPYPSCADMKHCKRIFRARQNRRERVILSQPFVISGQASAQRAVAA